MTTLLIILQFAIVVIICIAVLLQKSSSIGLGAYSGSNESLFGAKGPAGFLAKFTFIMGILLIANTIALSYMYNNSSSDSLATKAEQILPKAPEVNASVPMTPITQEVETNTSK
ncbi:preprotein translocase subunit SecG [Campylobacter volucris]|uniref:preprotein translocase subunit SecG n=1 Tax=Campylobacter volucris TaxID=1031542 RepID=UPI00189FBBCB|nr:preprotein translocase subunit SecG [Campylobacter volucris]MBF7069066.1 preprotein translocase subunit SecG [Campylobacter volucris]